MRLIAPEGQTQGPGLDDFAGAWRIERVIEDAQAGQRLTATGRAVFAPDGAGGLVLEEATELRLADGRRLAGHRRYRWRASPEGIAVDFEDGRPFHVIRAGEPCPEVRHGCPPDTYDGAYDFTGWPRFRVRWLVKGPRKDYRMETVFVPEAGSGE